jgi:hypothetical protein
LYTGLDPKSSPSANCAAVLEQEALELAKNNLASVNLLINVVVVTDEKRRSLGA